MVKEVQCQMKKADVQSKLATVPENVEKLELLRSKDYQEFRSDFRNIDSSLHRLQTSIQALVDIGSYIIAQLGLKTPGSSAEVIEILQEAGFIKPEDENRYVSMIQFRNRVVHLYNNINTEMLYQILKDETEDIKRLYGTLIEIIDSHEKQQKDQS